MQVFFTYLDVTIKLVTNNVDVVNFCINSFYGYFDTKINDVISSEIIINENVNCNKYERIQKYYSYDLYYNENMKDIFITALKNDYCIEIMRFIRELFIYFLNKKSSLFLHAACVEKNRKGIIILGEKGAGKTTTCIALLKLGYNFVSNDKLIIRNINQDIIWNGLPISIGIRNPTKNLFKELNDLYEKNEDGRYYIKPQKLTEKFKTKITKQCKASLILIPKYIESQTIIKVQKIELDDKRKIIKKQVLKSVYEKEKVFDEIDFYNQDITLNFFKDIPAYEISVNESLNMFLDSEITKILRG